MRLVHLSDLHLGYRQYQRSTPGGVNQREADVAATFKLAVDRVIDLAPDLVIVAGDIFHTVRPTNQAILHAFLQFGRLKRSLPQSTIVLVAGNHDTPRSAETGGILQLFSQLGIDVVDRDAQRLSLFGGEISLLAVPDVYGAVQPELTPHAPARYNVLALHGEIRGVLPEHVALADRAAIQIERAELHAKRWDYVALGHHHVYAQVDANAFYSGSIDYTSVDVWGELHEERDANLTGKGLIEHDLETGEHTFHALPPARALIDLPVVDARGLGASEVDARIQRVVERCDGGIDDRIVRLIVRDLPRHVGRELDQRAIREFKRRALNFQLDVRRPEKSVREQVSGAPGRRPSLTDLVRERLQSRALEATIDRAEFVERGMAYLNEAEGMLATAPVLVEG
jgi:DNA repair protein SbcD/Mre11